MTAPGRPVHQVLATLGYGDAIGHEVMGIQCVLRGAGYESDIFVETADPRLEHLTRDFRELPEGIHPDRLLVHHFSIGSKASRVAYALPDRMALVYHNITPPEFFLGIHEELVERCWKGRRELAVYADRVVLGLGDSEYNRQELETLGFRETGVLPVVPSLRHLDVEPVRVLGSHFDDAWTNVVFVGRMIPNKRIEDVIRIFHVYRRFHNPRSRLLFVGSYSAFETYLTMLHALVARLGLTDVHFLGNVSNEELTAIYDIADVFVCASEHEGFCVQIVEAFHKGVIDLVCHFPGLTVNKTLRIARRPTALEGVFEPSIGLDGSGSADGELLGYPRDACYGSSAGNPASVGSCEPLARKLCVPTFRWVCPCA